MISAPGLTPQPFHLHVGLQPFSNGNFKFSVGLANNFKLEMEKVYTLWTAVLVLRFHICFKILFINLRQYYFFVLTSRYLLRLAGREEYYNFKKKVEVEYENIFKVQWKCQETKTLKKKKLVGYIKKHTHQILIGFNRDISEFHTNTDKCLLRTSQLCPASAFIFCKFKVVLMLRRIWWRNLHKSSNSGIYKLSLMHSCVV